MSAREYRGWIITRNSVNGFYSAWKSGELRLCANTLAGLKRMIKARGVQS